jgi:alkanesulfonate monooxygenase SsuD/methylene tetrahydromethanopterin reductase-like flavin-dependent oxidoreductase (luciferase family)
VAIEQLGFLTPGNYADTDPYTGLEQSLQLFQQGEDLGYDHAWVRQRHLERAVSSASVFLGAASQRTRRIALGTAVIQMGYENPFRLAEDLATVDVLSRGRLHVGLSAGAPPYGPLLGERFLDGDSQHIDYSHERIARLRSNLQGGWIGDETALIPSPAGPQRARLHPWAPGLAQRLWYGGGSRRSVEWAGRNGFHLLLGNINTGETSDDFYATQRGHVALFQQHWTADYTPRIALGRVIVPLDSADAATRQRYLAYAESRKARTLQPQGERRTLFAPDLVGSSDEILEQLRRDPVLPLVRELRLELPYDFAPQDYAQILHDVVRSIAPELGWHAAAPAPVLEEVV